MNNKGQIGVIVFLLLIVAAAIVLAVGFDYVPAGNVGVLDTLGEVHATPVQPGVTWTGFTTSTREMNTRIQIRNYHAAAASKDLQVVKTTVALNFRIEPSAAPQIYKNIGFEYQDIIIAPVVQEAVKQGTSKYTAEELITKRTEAKADITNYITQKLESKGLIVEEVAITNFDFSPEFNNAIERKQVAEQDVLTAKNKLEETRLLVEGSKLQQEILAARELDLQEKWIAKWNGVPPSTLIINGDGANSDGVFLMLNPSQQAPLGAKR